MGPDSWLGRKKELGVLEYPSLEDRGMDVWKTEDPQRKY